MKAIGFITITFWIISFISCEDQDKEYNKGKTNTTFWLELIRTKKEADYREKYSCKSTGYEISNENNGTIKFKLIGNENCTTAIYYEICLQGQVYREKENDCKGTGDESNLYGAQLIQAGLSSSDGSGMYPNLASCQYDNEGFLGWDWWEVAYLSHYNDVKAILDTLIKANPTLDGIEVWNGTNFNTIKIPNGEIIRQNGKIKKYTLCMIEVIE